MYDLKQTLKYWYKNFNNFITNNGFLRYQADHCYCVKTFNGSYPYCYMLIMCNTIHNIIDRLTNKLLKKFIMEDMFVAKQILRIRIAREKEVLKLSCKSI